jgi:iron(III) transport system permease protein
MSPIRYRTLIPLLAFFVLAMLYPLSHVVSRAFVVDGAISMNLFFIMLSSNFYREVLFNSINLALTVTVISTLVAYPLALLMSRYHLPCHRIIHTLLLLPLISPPFVGALGVKQLFSRFGSANILLMELGVISEPVRWLAGGGVLGIVLLQALHLIPVLYLTIAASLQSAPISLEEAARVCGASKWRVLRKIVIPLSVPGWFAGASIVFIAALTDIGTPLIFEYRSVLSVQIFNMLSDLNENSIGYSFVVLTCALSLTLFFVSRTAVASHYSGSTRVVSGRLGSRLPRGYEFLATLVVGGYAVFTLVPQINVALIALADQWFLTALPTSWTGRHFVGALQHPMTTHSLLISILLSLAAGFFTPVIGVSAALFISRARSRASPLLEVLSILPLAIPGIVFAFGYIEAFSGTILDNRVNPLPLLLIAYTIRRTPQMVRSVTAGLEQSSVALEEAAFVLGSTPARTARRITLPLISKHVLVGIVLTFAYSMIEVSDSLLLAMEVKFYPVSKAIYALLGRPDGVELGSALGVIVLGVMLTAFYLVEVISKRMDRPPILRSVAILCCVLVAPRAWADNVDELVAVTPHWEGIKSEFSAAFSASHFERTGRSVAIRWLDVGGASDIVKYLKAQRIAHPEGLGIDIVFGGGADAMVDLSSSDVLAPVEIAPAIMSRIPPLMAGVPLYSKNRDWYAAAISTFGIICNRIAAERLKVPLPDSWADLGRPEYFDLVSIADPRKSGSMHAMFEVILQGYGWEQGWEIVTKIAANSRSINSTASQVGKDVASGDAICGIAIDTYAGDVIRRTGSDRVSYITPHDYPAINSDGIAVLRGAPNKALARDFVEFVLSEAGQKLWYYKVGTPGGPTRYEIGKLPVIKELYESGAPATVVSGNPFTFTNARAFAAELAAARWSVVNDLFGSFIIEVHGRLTSFARSYPNRPLPTVPLSQSEAENLSAKGPWGNNQTLRGSRVREWSDLALRQLTVGGKDPSRFNWAPSSIFLILIIFRAVGRSRLFSPSRRHN